MRGGPDGEYAGQAQYDAWDRTLFVSNPKTMARSSATADLLPQLHAIAAELRDRLRYSEMRTKQLKSELHDERAESLHKFSVLEQELLHLRGAVQQGADASVQQGEHAMQMQQELSATQQELSNAQQHAHTSAVTAENAVACAEVAEASRDAALEELAQLRAQLADSRDRAYGLESRAHESVSALMSNKAEMAELHQLQAMYQSAREELDRLDKENSELKDMVSANAATLARSRILDTLPYAEATMSKSTPLHAAPEAMMGQRRRGRASSRSPGRARSPGRDAIYVASGVQYPPNVSDSITALSRSMTTTNGGGGGAVLASAATLVSLAFLGPPSSAYPQDPDKFVFVRVAGGFAPKYIGSEPLPKASGWVPKDVVRLAQAFRASNRIKLEWRHWEPLLLMVDEIYTHGGRARAGPRGDARGARASARAEVHELPNQYAGSVASYPSVVQAGVIMQLKKQLAHATQTQTQQQQHTTTRSKGRSKGPTEDDVLWRSMAEKDYHMATQLGEAVGENSHLRSTMQFMEEMYSPRQTL
ncbi:hypothetical protein FOA52_007992 [Chlamydomonas sp. UWO 241]|nr:hypothetical protein FOA52_007992 [Chlamydomonas sp. UWO 241]